jgi:hypothetical protein
MKTLYLAWQDPEDRRWFPVGRLSFDGYVYRFVYTNGAKQMCSTCCGRSRRQSM